MCVLECEWSSVGVDVNFDVTVALVIAFGKLMINGVTERAYCVFTAYKLCQHNESDFRTGKKTNWKWLQQQLPIR